MADHPIFADDMQEIVESFLIETREIFEGLDHDILQLERTPDDAALVDQIFRGVHTVKGTSGFLNLEQLSVLAHHFEDVLNRIRRGTLAVRAGTVDVLLEAFDLMQALVQQVVDRRLAPLDLDPIIQKLKGLTEAQTKEPEAQTKEPEVQAADEPSARDDGPQTADDEPQADAELQANDEPQADDEPRTAERSPAAGRPAATETIRVGVDRLDALMDLVGELVLSRNRLLQLLNEGATAAAGSAESADLLHEVGSASAQLDFITTELQTAVMRTRMVQIGRAFARFPRMIRDLAADCGKEIDLVMEGEETELDKSLTEDLADPLVHLVRNAVDHGIEPPEERLAAGKPRRGRVRIDAAHEGDHILIGIEDDGRGMQPEKLRAKAVEKGILTPQEAAELSESEALELIFRPGFSTAQTVSQVSGRGVGMDVVKTNLTRLNGSISIASTPGAGTRFTLKLPLTLAIIQSLLVRAGEETFAIPLHAVDEVVALDEAASIRGREVMRHRDGVVPLVRIGEVLDVRDYTRRPGDEYAVLIRVGHHRLGLVVDALVSQKEVVIKPLGDYLKKPPCLAGSTILGDGRVVMILDLGELVTRARALRNARPAAA